MSNEDEFDLLSKTWQSSQPVKFAELTRRVKRKTLRMKLFLWADVIMYLAMFTAIAWVLSERMTPLFISWALFLIVFASIYTWYSVTLRLRALRPDTRDTRGLLDLSLKRAQDGITFARLCNGSVIAVMAFFSVWGVVEYQALTEVTDRDLYKRVAIYSFLLVYCIAWLLGTRIYTRRKKQEIIELSRMRDRLDQGD